MTQTFELKVKSLAGSACSSDGERILVGLNAERSGTLNLTLSPFQALSLITLLSSATSEAAGIRADDPSLKHAFSVAGIEIDRSQSGRFLRK